MYPIGVVGPGSERLAERLAEHFTEYGRVGVIASRRNESEDGPAADGGSVVEAAPVEEVEDYRTVGAMPVYRLDDEGWTAVGDEMTVREVLRTVARTCDFCIFEGTIETSLSLPRVVLGDGEPVDDTETEAADGPVLAEASTPDAVDLEAVREALEDTEPIETLESLVEKVKRSPKAPQSGAIATFTGRVRAQEDDDDTPTEYLEFEKYDGIAEKRMEEISAELEARDGVHEVRMHHRSGRLDYGEDIVFVVVLAGHREEAFRTVEDGIDRLKAEVPIFKKEATIDEEFWVHDRP